MDHRLTKRALLVVAPFLLFALGAVPAAPPAPAPDLSEIKFTVAEGALLDCLRAATPQTVTVGSSLLSTELTFLDPSDMVLKSGKASFKIRVKGSTLPVNQIVNPVVTLDRDARSGQYFGVIASLPVQLPGLGTIDLKDYLPRIEIPPVLENLYQVADRPLGLRLKIRKIAILDHLLEVGADVDFAPVVSTRSPG